MGLTGAVKKDYNRNTLRKADWGFGAEGRLNIGDPVNFILTEGYAKFRYGVFELKAGRVKEVIGLCDTVLSSGSWGVSGNALGIPKFEISIPEFYTIPWFGGLFAFKGSYSNGSMGNWYIHDEIIPGTPTYLIQHTFYGRLGKPHWKFKLFGGFNHQVVWGNEKMILGEDYKLSGFQTFIYANLAKPYNNKNIQNMRVGNHLGSIDLGMTYDFNDLRLFIYRQFIYDAGAMYYLANLRDGLNGISVTNKHAHERAFTWNRFLVEFLYTKNQAGETWSPKTASIHENYYNNGYYPIGWSYKGPGIGNPFISYSGSIKEGLPEAPSNYFTNNRVLVVHAGIDLGLSGWNFISKMSYSKNYGTYLTSPDGKMYNGENTEALYGIFPVTNQFSAYIEAGKNLKKGFRLGIMGALDSGGLYNDAFGMMGMVSKTF
jgi:hypothetical protein